MILVATATMINMTTASSTPINFIIVTMDVTMINVTTATKFCYYMLLRNTAAKIATRYCY